MTAHKQSAKSGFTLMETMVSVSISTLVLVAVLGTFLWCGKQSVLCSKMGWSQREAMVTQTKLVTYLRNAQAILDIDEEYGRWVQLGFPDGSTCTLVYSNAVPLMRDGRMYLEKDNGSEMVVTRGMTEIMTDNGFSNHVFIGQKGGSSLRVAYRISEPTAAGNKSSNDGGFAVEVRFSAALRNSGS